MRNVLAIAALPFVAILATPAFAIPGLPPVTVAVTGGTLGVGPEVTYRMLPMLAVRGSATFLGFSGHGDVSNYRYDGHVHLSNFGGTIDVHPLLNGFRISGGVRSTDSNRIRFHGMASGPQTYGGVTYTPEQAGELSGRIETKSVSPLVTIGYAHTTLSGITFGIDGGVMFHGHPQVRDVATTGELASNPYAQAQLATQLDKLRNRVSDYPYYPVVQLSLGYRF